MQNHAPLKYFWFTLLLPPILGNGQCFFYCIVERRGPIKIRPHLLCVVVGFLIVDRTREISNQGQPLIQPHTCHQGIDYNTDNTQLQTFRGLDLSLISTSIISHRKLRPTTLSLLCNPTKWCLKSNLLVLFDHESAYVFYTNHIIRQLGSVGRNDYIFQLPETVSASIIFNSALNFTKILCSARPLFVGLHSLTWYLQEA